MQAREALRLVGKSVRLTTHSSTTQQKYDYYVWLSFVEEYSDVNYSQHANKLDELLA